MADDASRFPQGVVIDTATLAVARPVGTLVYDTGTSALYRSTNATVATYTAIGTSGTFPQGTSLTFATGTGTVVFTGGATNVVITDTGGAGLVQGDNVPWSWGTGLDVVFTPDGTNLLVTTGAGLGALLAYSNAFRCADRVDPTKRLAFDMASITTGTTRTITAPDFNYAPGVSVTPATTADPGTGVAIPVTGSTSIDLTTGTGAETNTLAIPTAVGQQISIVLGTAGGGTRTITAASAINQAGNTKMAFTQANDWILLRGVSIAGTLAWRVAANDGVTLS